MFSKILNEVLFLKTIAMYLPQFHRTEENDRWWGEGFTDWVSARNAKPLFSGHYQPHEPLNDNYYDLTDKAVMKWQAELAKEYKVDGFCLYHYWFKDGATVLEKPAENLLKWKDIDIEFCFSWDSNAWVRTWSRMSFNYSWDMNVEAAKQGTADNGILIDQKFGREDAWKKHFDYLIPFFLDKRYIKKNNKPLFLFYAANNIYCLDDMLDCWNNWARDIGFDGIYAVVTNCDENSWDNVDASLMQLPGAMIPSFISANKFKTSELTKMFDYGLLWDQALTTSYSEDKTVYYGAFTNYDDTPRRKPGTVFTGATPESFKANFKKILNKNYYNGNEFVFINAWNEWGEGMHLEPDKRHGYSYLDALKSAKDEFERENKNWNNNIVSENKEMRINKMSEYFELMNEWMYKLEDNKSISTYFIKNGFKKIAVYGYGHMTKHLLFQLQNTEIEVLYVIEQNKPKNTIPHLTLNLEDKLGAVDAIVVTPFIEYIQIKRNIMKRINCPIISIKEVIMEV